MSLPDRLASAVRQVRTDVVHALDEPFPPGAHDTRSALTVGRLLGVAIGTAFVTGMISHLHQHPIGWLELPSRPVWGYRFTQGLHVASGIAAVPLLLAKLWVVYRRLFTWPPVRSASHGLERLLLVPLVAGTVFELVSGLLNVARNLGLIAAVVAGVGLLGWLAGQATTRRKLAKAAMPPAKEEMKLDEKG